MRMKLLFFYCFRCCYCCSFFFFRWHSLRTNTWTRISSFRCVSLFSFALSRSSCYTIKIKLMKIWPPAYTHKSLDLLQNRYDDVNIYTRQVARFGENTNDFVLNVKVRWLHYCNNSYYTQCCQPSLPPDCHFKMTNQTDHRIGNVYNLVFIEQK